MKLLFIISWVIVAFAWTCVVVTRKRKDGLKEFFTSFVFANLWMYVFASVIVFITVLIKFGISVNI